MKTKDLAYAIGSFFIGTALSSCGPDNNETRLVKQGKNYSISDTKPDYDIGQIVLNDQNKIHSSFVRDSIFTNVSLLNDYRKDKVSDPSDNSQWIEYVNLDESTREMYNSIVLRSANLWNSIENGKMSEERKRKALSDYESLVENVDTSLGAMCNLKIDPFLQIADKYTSISLLQYDSKTKNVLLYRVMFGDGGENTSNFMDGSATKSERQVRLQKVNLGKNPDDILKNYRSMSGELVSQIDLSLDFVYDNFTYNTIMDILDGKK
jgi:hypothetical protein